MAAESSHKRNKSQCIGTIGKGIVVCEKLIFGSYLKIICRFELSVHHVIFFHTHESCIRIGLGITVPLSQYSQMIFIFFELWQVFFLECLYGFLFRLCAVLPVKSFYPPA